MECPYCKEGKNICWNWVHINNEPTGANMNNSNIVYVSHEKDRYIHECLECGNVFDTTYNPTQPNSIIL